MGSTLRITCSSGAQLNIRDPVRPIPAASDGSTGCPSIRAASGFNTIPRGFCAPTPNWSPVTVPVARRGAEGHSHPRNPAARHDSNDSGTTYSNTSSAGPSIRTFATDIIAAERAAKHRLSHTKKPCDHTRPKGSAISKTEGKPRSSRPGWLHRRRCYPGHPRCRSAESCRQCKA